METSTAEKKAAEHGVHFIETSAKSGYNVNNLFQRIARAITGIIKRLNAIECLLVVNTTTQQKDILIVSQKGPESEQSSNCAC